MDKTQQEILCKNIKAYRKKLNITQEQLAEKLGYTKQAISNWETGKNIPNDEDLERMAKLFGVNTNELIDKKIIRHSDSGLEFIEMVPVPYRMSTYALFFKNNVDNIWSAWIYDMDYPIMLFSGYSCSIHDDYLSFKNDFMKDVDDWVIKARDIMDCVLTFEDTVEKREAKEMFEYMEAFADDPESFRSK